MNKTILLLIIGSILFSCTDSITDKEQTTITGTITALTEMGSTSVDSIMVILINANYEPDTIEYNNEAAFVDTVYTNESGEFAFNNVAPGKYHVYPTKESYQFTGENIPIENVIEVEDGDNIEVFYTAAVLLQGGRFRFTWKLVNYPELDVDSRWIRYSQYYLEWILFVPKWRSFGTYSSAKDGTMYSDSFLNGYGFTRLYYTLTNAFKFEITLPDGKGGQRTKTFKASTPITNTPEEVYFEFDWATGEAIRIE